MALSPMPIGITRALQLAAGLSGAQMGNMNAAEAALANIPRCAPALDGR